MSYAELKSEFRIEDVISLYVKLRPYGSYMVGRCLFHDDRGRPNMVVFPRSQTYKCFACGVRGDVIDFVARVEHTSQSDAAKLLRVGSLHAGRPRGPRANLPAVAEEPLADPQRRHTVYRAFLSLAPLSEDHVENLKRRGFTNEEIRAGQYGSLPSRSRAKIVRRLIKQGFDLRGVPGFAMNRKTKQWGIFGPNGLLIPVRDTTGKITALQVRLDGTRAGKYRWLSSPDNDKRVGGASSGAPCHVSGRRFYNGKVVWLTEGPLKADAASNRLSAPFLGVAGVGNWRRAVEVIRALEPGVVIIAFDHDESATTRRAVQADIRAVRTALKKIGVKTKLAVWREGKGIDDALAMGQTVWVIG